LNKFLDEIYEDKAIVDKIRRRLPILFKIAELECSRAGKTGMQVGSMRESIIIALLIYKFGANKVKEFPITEPEKDIELVGKPISIKTITGKTFGNIKASWTVDQQKSREFTAGYIPASDMLLVQINWGGEGGMYYIPVEVQTQLLEEIGIENFINLPKADTNPRGNNFNAKTVLKLVNDKNTKVIKIAWPKIENKFDSSAVYKRWVDYWSEE
jgi:hypothetical protein